MQIDSYRTRLEEFEQNLNRELYRYYAGLKDQLELTAVYRECLCNKYGNAWFRNRSAAGFLKEIWEMGQLYRAEELGGEIGIGNLDPQIPADELSGGLQH